MGLDMYLRAKTKTLKSKGATGACGGLFPIAPKDNGMAEIGYWRKAYDQQELICKTIASYDSKNDNCVEFIITAAEIDTIIKQAKKELESGTFDEEGGNPETEEYTLYSKQKWEKTIKFFRKAKRIMKKDPEAEIYYYQWY